MDQHQGSAAGLPGRLGASNLATPILSALFFLAIFYIPGIGMALNLLAPLPLIYFFFTHGRKPWLMAVGGVTLFIALTFNLNLAMFYLLTYGTLSYLMSELILRKDVAEKVVGVSAIVPLMLTGLFFFLTFPAPISEVFDIAGEKVNVIVAETIASYKKAGMPAGQADELMTNIEGVAGWFITMLPAITASGYILLGLGNFMAYKRIQSRYTFLPQPDPAPIKFWMPPDRLVFVLIASFAALLLGFQPLDIIGANFFIISLFIYALAGIAVIEFFLDKIKAPFFLRIVAYMLIMIQPFFLSMIAGVGLFDLWIDFRKIRQTGEKDNEGKF